MEKTDKWKSSFGGFLEGYKSRNIQSIEQNLKFKIDEIYNLTSGLVADLEQLTNKNTELNNSLKRALEFLKPDNDEDIFNGIYSFGESLNYNISVLKKIISGDQAQEELNGKMRKILYNYAELAKRSEDGKLIELALKLLESY